MYKYNAAFTKCIAKVDGAAIDDVEDLGLVILMKNLLEDNLNYSVTTCSLWFYFKDKATNFNTYIEHADDFKYFKYKAKLLGDTKVDGAN